MPLLRKPFYIMRHGQTTDNAAGMISGGGRDPDLTELGRTQALAAREFFLRLTPAPTRIVVSTLKRTHQTATLVTGHNDFIIEAGLNERYLGHLDGTITEAEQKDMQPLPGEETSAKQFARVIAAINAHLAQDGIPLFVCHGGTVRRVMEAVELQSKVSVGNAEIFYCNPLDTLWAMKRIG